MNVINQDANPGEVALLEVHPGEVAVVREVALLEATVPEVAVVREEEARQKLTHQQALKRTF